MHLTRLPAYLTIQFVRFFYKEKEKVNAKILKVNRSSDVVFDLYVCVKDVQYSMVLDVFDLCTPEMQKRLMPIREKIKHAEDAKLERERAKVLQNILIYSSTPIFRCFRNSQRQSLKRKI